MPLVIFSPGRAQQLRILLWATVVIGALLAALATFLLVVGGPVRFALFVAVPAVLVLVLAVIALRRLEQRGAAARWWTVATGVLLILLAVLLTQAAVGLLPSIIGVLLVLLALLPDVGDH